MAKKTKAKILSDKDAQALREKAKKECERLAVLFSDPETKAMVDRFKDKFSACEIVYKVILRDYLVSKDGSVNEASMKIHMQQVKAALRRAGYIFDESTLEKLFGSEDEVGKRSAKKLRDELTHKLKQSAIDELRKREDELNDYMDSFFDLIVSS